MYLLFVKQFSTKRNFAKRCMDETIWVDYSMRHFKMMIA